MSATVVNIKFGDEYDVYIGRPGKGQEGPWGNPFHSGLREDNIERYRDHIMMRIHNKDLSLEDLAALDGKRLGCFCAPEPCHGDVLAELATWAKEELNARVG